VKNLFPTMKPTAFLRRIRTVGMLIVAALLVAYGGTVSAQGPAPRITAIKLFGDQIEVSVVVPLGIERVVLESCQRDDLRAWTPRGIKRASGARGILFRLSASAGAPMELFRVRVDETDPLPATFYSGKTHFGGEPAGEIEGVVPPVDFNPAMKFVSGAGGVVGAGPVGDGTGLRPVEESDIWRANGDRIYFFNSARGLQVIDISVKDAPVLRGSLRVAGTGEQMYLLGDDHVVLLVDDRCDGGSTGYALIVDVTAADPREVARLPLDGPVLESRLVGQVLHVATRTWEPSGKDGVWQEGVNIHSFDLAQPTAPVSHEGVRLNGSGNVVSATPTHLFVTVATNGWPRQDVLHVFNIGDAPGDVHPVAEIPLGGALLDKFKLQQQGDLLAVVTEVRSDSGSLTSVLTTYRLPGAGGTGWQKLGSVPFGKGESLFATRFEGTRLYAVTYRRTDPLWILDFADAAHPSIVGELHVPGWSTYIQPLGDRLLTIGIDDTTGNRVAVQLFDVADPAKPGLLSKAVLGDGWSTSEALGNEKAFGVFPDEGLVLVPISSWTTNGYVEAVQLVDLSSNAVTARAAFTNATIIPRRTLIRAERFFTISTRELLGIDFADRDAPVLKSRLELGYPVDRILPVGDWLVEFAGNEVHVSSAAKPGVALQRYALDGPRVIGATVAGDRIHLLQGEGSNEGFGLVRLWAGTQPENSTNRGTMRHVVLDAAALPDLAELGRDTWKTKAEGSLSGAEPLWPTPGLLVWSVREQRSWWGPWYMMPYLIGVDSVSRIRPGLVGPYRPQGQPFLLEAVNVGDATHPRFQSETPIGASALETSAAFAAEGLVYASQTTQHSEIASTNYYVQTNQVWFTMTNEVWWTNLVFTQVVVTETNLPAPITVSAVRLHRSGTALAGGRSHSLVLDDTGDVFGWGDNAGGSVGTAGSGVVSVPTRVALSSPMVAVAGANWQSFAVGSDGTVWNWGSWDGPLPPLPGQPPSDNSTPRKILFPEPMAAIASGGWHALALDRNGQLWAWGHNEQGQLGLGNREFGTEPQPVPGTAFRAVSGGLLHSLALDEAGRIWSWGWDDSGQLGRRGAQEFPNPVTLPSGVMVRAVAAGGAHSLALVEDGTVWGWGNNAFYQLGAGPPEIGQAPHPIAGLPAIRSIAGGTYHTLALAENGEVWFIGREPVSLTPVMARVQGLTGVTAIGAGRKHSLAVTGSGDLFVWGADLATVGGMGESVSFTLVSELPVVAQHNAGVITTNISRELVVSRGLRREVVTNAVPVTRFWNQHELVVTDFGQDPAAPVVREPISFPGLLAGISHGGAMVYAASQATVDGSGVPVGATLHGLAYDGLSAHLVDSVFLSASNAWNAPLVAVAPNGLVVTERNIGTTNELSRIETWKLGSTGTFSRLGSLDEPAVFSELKLLGDIAAFRTSNGVNLVDLAQPTTPQPMPGEDAIDCLGLGLPGLQGDRTTGLWIPAGELGSLPVWRP
jgi:alpha-tubulin suppressor-like RCC1 family protein